jgi:hypothetical protein
LAPAFPPCLHQLLSELRLLCNPFQKRVEAPFPFQSFKLYPHLFAPVSEAALKHLLKLPSNLYLLNPETLSPQVSAYAGENIAGTHPENGLHVRLHHLNNLLRNLHSISQILLILEVGRLKRGNRNPTIHIPVLRKLQRTYHHAQNQVAPARIVDQNLLSVQKSIHIYNLPERLTQLRFPEKNKGAEHVKNLSLKHSLLAGWTQRQNCSSINFVQNFRYARVDGACPADHSLNPRNQQQIRVSG